MSRPENPKYNFLNPLVSNIKYTSHAVWQSKCQTMVIPDGLLWPLLFSPHVNPCTLHVTGHLISAPRIKFVCKVVLELKHSDSAVNKIVLPIKYIHYMNPVSVCAWRSFVCSYSCCVSVVNILITLITFFLYSLS